MLNDHFGYAKKIAHGKYLDEQCGIEMANE